MRSISSNEDINFIPFNVGYTADASASQTRTITHATKHSLDIMIFVGTADNAPDPCKPSLCYGKAYLRSTLSYTINPYPQSEIGDGCNNQFSAGKKTTTDVIYPGTVMVITQSGNLEE